MVSLSYNNYMNEQTPKEKLNVPLEELLTSEELAVIKEMRANVQIKDTAAMDAQESPLYEPLTTYERVDQMELAKTLTRRLSELKRQNAPLHLLPEKVDAFFTQDPGNRRTPAIEFCALLQETGSIPAACAQIKKHYPRLRLSTQVIDDYRTLIPTFGEQVDFAIEMFNAKLEGAAVERAVEGVDEPVFYQGVECGSKKKYSDDLLKFLMQANNPTKYGKADGKGSTAPIVVQIANFQQASDYAGDNGLLTEVTQYNNQEDNTNE